MKSVILPVLATALALGGCTSTRKNIEPTPPPQAISWSTQEILGEFVCGSNVLIRHKNGLYLETGTELVKPNYQAKVVTNPEGGYTTEYDYDEKANTLTIIKSSRYYGVRPPITVKCQ